MARAVAIARAKRRFYLRPGYLLRHLGDIARLVVTKWHVAWHVGARIVFGTKVAGPAPSPAPPALCQRAA